MALISKTKMMKVKDNIGFTYIEVMIALMIFALMFVFIARLGNSIFDLNRVGGIENRMVHLAGLEIENYKSGINDRQGFVEYTGFVVKEVNYNSDNVLLYVRLFDEQVDNDFEVTIEETFVTDNISRVDVTVHSQDDRASDVVLTAQMIKDSLR